jgi:electron transfer flavoprotein alpha subunit
MEFKMEIDKIFTEPACILRAHLHPLGQVFSQYDALYTLHHIKGAPRNRGIFGIHKGPSLSLEIHPESKGSVHIIRTNFVPIASQTLEIKESKKGELNLGDADVIVSAGRGVRNPENIHLLEELAKIFPKSALGGSKAACDLGWLAYQHQIGITGQTVSPRLYIACGISGSVQHISGMRGSQTIIGINSDPDASIFNVADYGIVENLETFIPTLLEEFRHFSAPS